MSSEPEDYAYDEYAEAEAREAYEQELIEGSLKELSEENIRSYLFDHNEDILARIDSCASQGKRVHDAGCYGAAVVLSATAIEIIIRDLLVTPLIQGAFLSGEWASILAGRISNGRTTEDRKLLPLILAHWGIKIESVMLAEKEQLWSYITKDFWPKRNRIVHTGETATEAEALKAIQAVGLLISKAVTPILDKLGVVSKEDMLHRFPPA